MFSQTFLVTCGGHIKTKKLHSLYIIQNAFYFCIFNFKKINLKLPSLLLIESSKTSHENSVVFQ